MQKLIEKLLSKRNISPSPDGRFQDCWWWIEGCNSEGYGIVYFNYNQYKVHRLSAQIHNLFTPEDIPFTLNSLFQVLHHCDNRKCFNPNHLWIGLNDDNVKDMINKRRHRGRSKLTKDQAIEIRKLYKEGWDIYQLKDKFKVSYFIVRDIVWNRTYNQGVC